MKVINLINLDTIGGVERLYRQWLISSSIDQQVTLSDRRTIHNYISNDVGVNSRVYYTKKNKFIPLPKRFRERHVKSIMRRESPDAVVIWNKIDKRVIDYIAGKAPVIYYDHGASWMAEKFGADTEYWEKINKIVCVSNSAVKILNFRFPTTKEIDTEVIYNPNLMERCSVQSKSDQESFTFGIASRLIARKGIPIVLDAMKLLLDDDIHVYLYVAGSGKYLEELKLYSQKLNIEKHVTWMGNIDDIELFYKKIQVLVCPSIYEPFGLTVFEAASHGVPVIAAGIDGIHEAVKLVGGRLIKPKVPIEDYARKYKYRVNELDSLSYFHEEENVAPSLALDPVDLFSGMKRMAVDAHYYTEIKNQAMQSLAYIPTIKDWAYRLDNFILG